MCIRDRTSLTTDTSGGPGDQYLNDTGSGFAITTLLASTSTGTISLTMGGELTDGDGTTTLNITADVLTITGGFDVTSIETDVDIFVGSVSCI